jgi:DNA repair exonuclease SbcCD ATPase subunit
VSREHYLTCKDCGAIYWDRWGHVCVDEEEDDPEEQEQEVINLYLNLEETMLDEFAVEKLKQIKAGFDALQAELEEARAELAAAKARIAELEAARRWAPIGEMCNNLPTASEAANAR